LFRSASQLREGGLFLKTLRGLQPIGVLLCGIEGRSVDPLELEPDGIGVPGLFAAARDHVRILNNPGSFLAEAPALAAFLPDLARRLLGEDLALPSVPTLWLGDAAAHSSVLRAPAAWCFRPALDGGLPPVSLRPWPRRTGARCLAGWTPHPGASRRTRSARPRWPHAWTRTSSSRVPSWCACSWSATAPAGAPSRVGLGCVL